MSTKTQGAYVWLYPTTDQTIIHGRGNITYYVMGTGAWRKGFCKTCGVQLMNEINPLTDDEVAALPELARAYRKRMINCRPINLRILNDYDFSKLETLKYDGYNAVKPMYVNP